MDKKDITLLAKMTVESEDINEKLITFVRDNLHSSDLDAYVKIVKNMLESKTITVTSPDTLDQKTQMKIEELYEGRFIRYNIDPALAGGLVIKDNDTIIDASVRGQIKQVIDSLEETL